MVINAKLTQLAVVMNIIHIASRALISALFIYEVDVPSSINHTLTFIAEIAYVLVILYLVAILKHIKARQSIIGLIIFLVLGLFSFIVSITSNLFPHNYNTNAYILMVNGTIMTISVIYLFITSFWIKSDISKQFRIFFTSMLFVTLFKIIAPLLFVSTFELRINNSYYTCMSVISLLPAFTIFFILQKVQFMLVRNN